MELAFGLGVAKASRSPRDALRSRTTRGERLAHALHSARPRRAAAAPTMMAKKAREYDMKTRLREELEAPFRKVRMTLYFASAASASVGAFVSFSRIVAAFSGVRGVQPLRETGPNFAIDIGVIVAAVLLYRREVEVGERRLERMSRGAMLGALPAELADNQRVKISDLRGSRRVVVVAGGVDKVAEILEPALEIQDELAKRKLVVVPVAFNDEGNSNEVLQRWRSNGGARAIRHDEWKLWGEEEARRARLNDITSGAFVVIVRKDGRVGARSSNGMMWDRLLKEVDKLPDKDRHGSP